MISTLILSNSEAVEMTTESAIGNYIPNRKPVATGGPFRTLIRRLWVQTPAWAKEIGTKINYRREGEIPRSNKLSYLTSFLYSLLGVT